MTQLMFSPERIIYLGNQIYYKIISKYVVHINKLCCCYLSVCGNSVVLIPQVINSQRIENQKRILNGPNTLPCVPL